MDNFLFISEFFHFLLTLVIALFLYRRYHNWRLLPVCSIFGFLIDSDHLFDYFSYVGLRFDFGSFLRVDKYMLPSSKIYVLLHGWEYLLIFGSVGYWLQKRWSIRGLVWAITLPYLGHLIIDSFSYFHHPLAYLLIYRLLNNFSIHPISGGLL
jgi:hypothetical protein